MWQHEALGHLMGVQILLHVFAWSVGFLGVCWDLLWLGSGDGCELEHPSCLGAALERAAQVGPEKGYRWGQASREAVRGCVEGMLGAERASKRLTNRTNSGWPRELAAGSAAQRAPATDILSPAGHGLRSQPAAQHTQTAFAWER